MKAVLYAVMRGGDWEARVSVDWETDLLYWSDKSFRLGVQTAFGRPNESESATALLRLNPALPLGIAETAAGLLPRSPGKAGAQPGSLRADAAAALLKAAARAGDSTPARDSPGSVERIAIAAAGPDLERPVDSGAFERGRIAGAQARMAADRLKGCFLLEAEAAAALAEIAPASAGGSVLPVLQLASLTGGLRLIAGVAPVSSARPRGRRGAALRCRRCGSGEERLRRTPCASCGRPLCAYCESCLTMGRSRACGLIVAGCNAEGSAAGLRMNKTPPDGLAGRWGLSPAQSAASATALAFVRQCAGSGVSGSPMLRFTRGIIDAAFGRGGYRTDGRTFLLWAVTGAGKTEMIFPLLADVVGSGGKAAVATPRRDVVFELAPRLKAAFPDARHTVLHGGSADRFEAGDITLATTHQLIRFREAFDLVVIDEVDAFPFHNDPMLHHAAANAASKRGAAVLLSATPPAAMRRLARWRLLPHARVSVRHHGRPLPVPRRIRVPPLSRWLAKGRDSRKLRDALRASVSRGAQLFLFVPFIRQVEPLVQWLRREAAAYRLDPEDIAGTSSQDPERGGKVEAFRARRIRMLVTTTILERGVTIPKSDVFVLDADKPLFDASSLVQMAGRAGRSADDPAGNVYFAASAWTASQKDACRQIKEMNRFAARRGDLRR